MSASCLRIQRMPYTSHRTSYIALFSRGCSRSDVDKKTIKKLTESISISFSTQPQASWKQKSVRDQICRREELVARRPEATRHCAARLAAVPQRAVLLAAFIGLSPCLNDSQHLECTNRQILPSCERCTIQLFSFLLGPTCQAHYSCAQTPERVHITFLVFSD